MATTARTSLTAKPTGANKLTMQMKIVNQTAAKVQIKRLRNNSSNKKVKAIRNRSKERIV